MRSRSLDLVRFIYMLIICLWHTGWVESLCKGYSPVEFFFLTSGFFLYRLSEKATSIPCYFKSRLKRLYPAYIISLILYVVLLSENYRVLDFIYELSLVQDFVHVVGMNSVNRVVWYVSVLLWAGLLTFIVLRFTKNTVILLLTAICLYCCILGLCGNFNDTFVDFGIIHIPFWRGFAGLILGAVLAQTHTHINYSHEKPKSMYLLGVMGVIAFVLSLVLMFLPYETEFLSLFCYCIIILACMSCRDVFSKVDLELPDITYEMFLLHLLVIKVAVKILDMIGLLDMVILKYITYFILLVVISYLFNRVVKCLMSRIL